LARITILQFVKFVATEPAIGEGHKCKGIIRN